MDLANFFGSLSLEEQLAILDGPALDPPDGVVPNFDNPPNRNDIAYPVFITWLVVSIVFFLIHAYARWFIGRKMTISDIFMLLAVGCSLTDQIMWLEQLGNPNEVSVFVHQWDVRLTDFHRWLYSSVVTTSLYTMSVLLLKTAILLEWIRIFSPRGKRDTFFWACVWTIICNGILWTSGIFLVIFQCIPRESIYNLTVSGKCVDIKMAYAVAAVLNVILDLVILLLPQRVIWKLKLSVDKRMGVSLIFFTGILACVCAGTRAGYTVAFYKSSDLTYDWSNVGLWATAEMACGIAVYCTPSFPVTFSALGLNKMAATLKFWGSKGQTGERRVKRSIITWGGGGGGDKRPRSTAYDELSENNMISLTEFGAGLRHHIAELPDAGRRDVEYGVMGPGITRTTEFTATIEDTRQVEEGHETYTRQHPWMQQGRLSP